MLAVSASGNVVPPQFVFPRVNFKKHFIKHGPPGCIGTAHPSGWMTEENFMLFIKHFVKVVRCTKENPVLLLLDNHDSHTSIHVIDYCRDNGVVLLSFPPHCSHKLQPLDRSVYGPFKKYYNAACGAFLKTNRGLPMTMLDIPEIAKQALPLATTPANIQKGFQVAGIFPFNDNVFADDEFLPSYTTDRPMPEEENRPTIAVTAENSADSSSAVGASEESEETSTLNSNACAPEDTEEPATSSNAVGEPRSREDTMPSFPTGIKTTPEMIRPFNKAAPRKKKFGGRKKRRSSILTSTPERHRFQEEHLAKVAKKPKIDKKKITKKQQKET